MLTIETTRYSAVVKAILEQYPDAEVKLDGKPVTSDQGTWCTNAKLKETYHFFIEDNGKAIFGFWDGPEDMWADDEILPFIQTLADQKLLSFSHARYVKKMPLAGTIFFWILLTTVICILAYSLIKKLL